MYYTYRIENTENGKMYFGYTNVNPETFTFEQLLNFAQDNVYLRHLYNSMKKYGADAFRVTVVSYFKNVGYALRSEMALIMRNETNTPSKGYNYKGAELIPCHHSHQNESTTVAEEKDPADVISAATKTLFVLRNCIRAKDFEQFFSEYVYFNSIIPVTGVYDHFGLALDGMMVTLFEICRDCLSVYIKEHLKVR